MPFLIPLIIAVIPAILLGLNIASITPSNADYAKLAQKKAYSEFFKSGSMPTTVNVMGADMPVNPAAINTDSLLFQYVDNLAWKKANAEQALIAVCNQLSTKCNKSDVDSLFSFMPTNLGTIHSLLAETYSPTINCNDTNTYPAYGRYLLQQAITSADAAHTVESTSYTLYYNKPTTGSGCYHVDIVIAKSP